MTSLCLDDSTLRHCQVNSHPLGTELLRDIGFKRVNEIQIICHCREGLASSGLIQTTPQNTTSSAALDTRNKGVAWASQPEKKRLAAFVISFGLNLVEVTSIGV